MAVKSGRFGKFLACTGYPECKSTKPFQIKTGAKCPECGKDLVQRMSKKKRVSMAAPVTPTANLLPLCSRWPSPVRSAAADDSPEEQDRQVPQVQP